MTLVDIDAVTRLLIRTEREVDELGWDQPDLLFAMHLTEGQPALEFVLQIPGRPTPVLRDLITVGVRVRPGVAGLVLVTGGDRRLDVDELLALPVATSTFVGAWDELIERLATAWESLSEDAGSPARPSRAVVCVLADGISILVAHRAGEPARAVERLPEDLADHDEMTHLVMRMLVGDRIPMPRTATPEPRIRMA